MQPKRCGSETAPPRPRAWATAGAGRRPVGGRYVCRAWHLFDLELVGYRPRATAAVAAAIYLNFFSHHWLPDVRWPLAGLLVAVTAGTVVHCTVRGVRRRMPLALSFVLIGFFLWVAENLATYLGAWRYPYQLHGWQPVAVDKIGAWSLLISITVVLVAAAGRPGAARRRG